MKYIYASKIKYCVCVYAEKSSTQKKDCGYEKTTKS